MSLKHLVGKLKWSPASFGTDWLAEEISSQLYREVTCKSTYLHRDMVLQLCHKEYFSGQKKIAFGQKKLEKFIALAKDALQNEGRYFTGS